MSKSEHIWSKISTTKQSRWSNETQATIVTLIDVSQTKVTPTSCPVCDFMMRTDEDTRKYEKHGCCLQCAYTWADARAQTWADGWRPTAEDISAEIERRKLIPLGIRLDSLS